MEQGVHGLVGHDAVLGQLFVALRLPVHRKGLEVALCVGAAALDEAEQLQRPVQGGLLPGQPVVGGQGVDGKSLVVGVLGGVQRAAQSVAAPVDAAVFPVKAVVLEPLVGVAGAAGSVRPAGEHGRLGKEPEDAAVEDAALFGGLVHLQVKVHQAVVAAVRFVFEGHPEGQDDVVQHLLCRLFDAWHKKTLLFSHRRLPQQGRSGRRGVGFSAGPVRGLRRWSGRGL